MSMETPQLANVLQRLIKERDVLKDGLQVVQAIQGLEQKSKDLQSNIAAQEKRRDDLIADNARVADEITERDKASGDAVAKANERASGIVRDAEDQAAEIINKAKADAQQKIETAETNALTILAKANERIVDLEEKIPALEKEAAEKQEILDAVKTELDTASSDLEDIKKQAKKIIQ